jgi:PIN domain nuclease of toxin-antitoxin system
MRYYLDTNVLIFILSQSEDDLHFDIRSIVFDFSNILYVSSVSVKELVHLYKINKLRLKHCKSVSDVLGRIKKSGIGVIFFNEHHFLKYSHLELAAGHKDLNDHAIIAQAISDKIPLISSDKCFENYTSQGLNFIYNKR